MSWNGGAVDVYMALFDDLLFKELTKDLTMRIPVTMPDLPGDSKSDGGTMG